MSLIPMNPRIPGEVPNVVPFTIRENPSLIHMIEEMRKWIVTTLIPFVNDNMNGFGEEFAAEVDRLITEWETKSAALEERVDTAVAGIGTSVADAEAARDAAEAASNLAEFYATQAQEIPGAVITAIIADVESESRILLDSLYATKATQTTVETGRLAASALDARFNDKASMSDVDSAIAGVTDPMSLIITATQNTANDALASAGTANAGLLTKADKSVQDVVETGRLSASQLATDFGDKGVLDDVVTEVAGIRREGYPVMDGSGQKRYRMACGVLERKSSTSWGLLIDAGHDSAGISSVTLVGNRIRVNYSYSAKKVISAAVTGDQVFAKYNFRVGVSVGLTYTDIYVYNGVAGADEMDPRTISAVGANIWVVLVTEV